MTGRLSVIHRPATAAVDHFAIDVKIVALVLN